MDESSTYLTTLDPRWTSDSKSPELERDEYLGPEHLTPYKMGHGQEETGVECALTMQTLSYGEEALFNFASPMAAGTVLGQEQRSALVCSRRATQNLK